MRRRVLTLAVVPLILMGVAACGEEADTASSSAGASQSSEPLTGVEVAGEFGEAPQVTIDAPLRIQETQSEVVSTGEGAEVERSKQALLHLYLANGQTGKKVASTFEEGAPFYVQQVAEGALWPGVLDAILGQPVGSRLAVAAVPDDAYGAAGNPQLKLGKTDPVVFVVDVVSVEPSDVLDGPSGDEASDIPGDIPTVEEEDGEVVGLDFSNAPKKPADELRVVPLVEGDGPEVTDDSLVTFDYLGQVYGSEEVFDESYSKEPVAFPVGMGGLIKAWDEGLVGQTEGSRVLIIAPAEFAYGEQGRPPTIPANATLAFVVDILGVS